LLEPKSLGTQSYDTAVFNSFNVKKNWLSSNSVNELSTNQNNKKDKNRQCGY